MSSEAVVEMAHLRLHPGGSSSFPLASLATPDLPASLLDTWRQISSSASNAAGHCFRLYRSISEPADFYFVGGWDDPAVHAKTIARPRDSLAATSLGKWMEHISVRHIRANVAVFDDLGENAEQKIGINEWTGKVNEEDWPEDSKTWITETSIYAAGWDISEEVQSKHEEFGKLAKVLDKDREVLHPGERRVDHGVKAWVALRFGWPKPALEEQASGETGWQALDLVLGARPDMSQDSNFVQPSDQSLEPPEK